MSILVTLSARAHGSLWRRTLTASRGSRARICALTSAKAHARESHKVAVEVTEGETVEAGGESQGTFTFVCDHFSLRSSLCLLKLSLFCCTALPRRAAHPRPTTNVDCHFFFFSELAGGDHDQVRYVKWIRI